MNTKDKLKDFVEQLKEDSKGSRWGIHGYSCVDDDYFNALDYVIERLEYMLEETTT